MVLQLIIIGVLCIIFNVLDSVSTHYALNKLPDNLKAKEANPMAASLMSKDPLISDLVKHISVTMIVVFFVLLEQKALLLEITIMLGLVVASNAYLIFARKITKRKVGTPIHYLLNGIGIPRKYEFWIFIVIIVAVAILGTHFILGAWSGLNGIK